MDAGEGVTRLLIATRNRGKVAEIRALLGPALAEGVELLSLSDLPVIEEPEEDGATFAENARIKALHYAGRSGLLCVADDSGLAVEPLGGRPGVLSARYAGPGATDGDNIARLLADLAPFGRPWKAAFVCAAAAALPGRVVAQAVGRVEGEIVPVPRGTGGFGYDPVFELPGAGRTMAEIGAAEKNRVSHRGAAVRRLLDAMRAAGVL